MEMPCHREHLHPARLDPLQYSGSFLESGQAGPCGSPTLCQDSTWEGGASLPLSALTHQEWTPFLLLVSEDEGRYRWRQLRKPLGPLSRVPSMDTGVGGWTSHPNCERQTGPPASEPFVGAGPGGRGGGQSAEMG